VRRRPLTLGWILFLALAALVIVVGLSIAMVVA
jgi:hypothetical protein